MVEASSLKRVAYSPGEFSELFGKSQTWGYRQIYAGKVNAITQHGRILIPAKEVERILESAGIYNGNEKPKKVKEKAEQLTPEQRSIWQRFLQLRRSAPAWTGNSKGDSGMSSRKCPNWKAASANAGLERVTKSWGGKP